MIHHFEMEMEMVFGAVSIQFKRKIKCFNEKSE